MEWKIIIIILTTEVHRSLNEWREWESQTGRKGHRKENGYQPFIFNPHLFVFIIFFSFLWAKQAFHLYFLLVYILLRLKNYIRRWGDDVVMMGFQNWICRLFWCWIFIQKIFLLDSFNIFCIPKNWISFVNDSIGFSSI